ncbi:structural maintenance of chromosomes protein 5-like [Pseudorasbora parva]|uniref:structural maintenance of chromosomes protein 5-like n=1 Tax=Pseudorasbora parva TaxID=51549 RepID=UPI00351E6E14
MTIAPGRWIVMKNKHIPHQLDMASCGVFMIMYALHIVLNEPVDFTAHDIPVIRRWWCLLLMENFALGGHGRQFAHWAEEAMAIVSCLTDRQQRNGTAEIEHDIGALEGVTPPQNLENENVMSNIREGVEWLKENHQLLKSKYLPPRIVCMEEEDALNALARLCSHCEELLDEDDEIRAPFYFTFKNKEDMHLFMSEVRDKKNARVSSFYNPEI